MKINALSLAICLWASGVAAQTPCYDKLREDGQRFMRARNYAEAINQFWAALISCPDKPADNDLDKLIRRCQENWVADLEKVIEREKTAAKEANEARATAEKAQKDEAVARQSAEENERRAIAEGRRAESLRLALLSDLARQNGKNSDALMLAWLSLRMAGGEATPRMVQAFGEAVRDSLTDRLLRADTAAEAIQCLPGDGGVLVKLADQSVRLLRRDQPGGVQLSLPKVKKLSSIVASNSGRYVLAFAENAVRIWNADGSPRATLSGHAEAVHFAVFSPDDQFVVTCGRDNMAQLWRSDGQRIATLAGHSGNVYEAIFSPDSRHLATRSSDGTARLWSVAGEALAVLDRQNIYTHDMAFGPDGQKILTASADGFVRLWAAADGRLLAEINSQNGPVREAFFAKSESGEPRIVARTSKGQVSIWNENGESSAALRLNLPVQGIANQQLGYPSTFFQNETNPGKSGQATKLLTWSSDKTLRLWDLNGTLLQTFPGAKSEILAAAFSPDGLSVLSTARDGLARLFDLQGNLLTEWQTGADNPAPALFSPDGQHVLLSDKGTKSLLMSPLPKPILAKMNESAVALGKVTDDLVRAYNIRFQ